MGSRRKLRELRAEHDAYVAMVRSTHMTVDAIPRGDVGGGRLLGPWSLEHLALAASQGGWADHFQGLIQVKIGRLDG